MTDLIGHFAAVRPGRGQQLCPCCDGRGEHLTGPGGVSQECYACDASMTQPAGQAKYCEGREPSRPQRRRHWRQGVRMLDLYHHTTPEGADAIMRERRMVSEADPDNVYFTTDPDPSTSQGAGRGGAVVHVRVPEHMATLDDEFPGGEQHYYVPLKSLRPAHFIQRTAGTEEYGGSHRPMDGPTVDDVTDMWGPDVYDHPQHYAGNFNRARKEGYLQLLQARGKPEHPVTIYRASPPEAPRRMHTGDWVSLSRRYAYMHIDGQAHPEGWHVHKATVPAKHVRDGGIDPFAEHGYWGPDIDTEPDDKAPPRDVWASRKHAAEGPVYYHGTRAHLMPGDLIHPGHRDSPYGEGGGPIPYVFMTPERGEADVWGRSARHSGDGLPKTYEVEPTGEFWRDSGARDSLMSAHPLKVVRRVPWGVGIDMHQQDLYNKGTSRQTVPPPVEQRFRERNGRYITEQEARDAANGIMPEGYLGTADGRSLASILGEPMITLDPLIAAMTAEGSIQVRADDLGRTAEVHPEAACPSCGTPAGPEDAIRFRINGQEHISNMVACKSCGTAFDASKSYQQSLADTEFGHQVHHERARELEEQRGLFKQVTDKDTKGPLGNPYSEHEELQRRHLEEHQNTLPIPNDPHATESGRQIYERRRNRVLREPGSTKPLELPDVNQHLSRKQRGVQGAEGGLPPGDHAPVVPGTRAARGGRGVGRRAQAAIGKRPEFQPAPEHLSDEERSAHHEREFQRDRDWRQSVRNGLTMGHLTNESARALGYYGRGHDQDDRGELNWTKLPHDLYHVTTDAAGVRQHGLRAPYEREGFRPTGLGGSEDDSISLTSSHPLAEGLLRNMREYHQALHSDPKQLWERAQKGDQGSQPFADDMAHYWDRDYKHGDALPHGLHDALHGIEHQHEMFTTPEEMRAKHGEGWEGVGEPYTGAQDGQPRYHNWHRPASPQRQLEQRSDLFKHFSFWRGHRGGPEDPTYLGNDPKAFAKLDPANFAVMHLHPRPGAQGYHLPAQHEYRITTGEAVMPHHWQHEAMGAAGPDITGLKFHHHLEGPPADAAHVMFAHPGTLDHCEYCETGNENYVPDSSKFVGHLAWNHSMSYHEPGEITAVETHPALKRRGIARQMLEHAQSYDHQPVHSSDRTDEGDEWAYAMGDYRGDDVPDMAEDRYTDVYSHMWERGQKLSPELRTALKGQLRKKAAAEETQLHASDMANHVQVHGQGAMVYLSNDFGRPRCDQCGHRVADPQTGEGAPQTRELSPAMMAVELPNRARARKQRTASSRNERGDRWHEYRNRYLPDTLHRGVHVQLDPDVHQYVHDESVPRADRARVLLDNAHRFGVSGLGQHWTPHVNVAHRAIGNEADAGSDYFPDEDDERWGDEDWDPASHYNDARGSKGRTTDVIFHARTPGKRNEIRDPAERERHAVGWNYSHDEDETFLREGTPLRIQGISWKEHQPEYPNEPYEHHDFDRPERHTAANQEGGELPLIPSSKFPKIDIPKRDTGPDMFGWLDEIGKTPLEERQKPGYEVPQIGRQRSVVRGYDTERLRDIPTNIERAEQYRQKRFQEGKDIEPRGKGEWTVVRAGDPGAAQNIADALLSNTESHEREREHGHLMHLEPGSVHPLGSSLNEAMKDPVRFLRNKWHMTQDPTRSMTPEGKQRSQRWTRDRWQMWHERGHIEQPLACEHGNCPPWQHKEGRTSSLDPFVAAFERTAAEVRYEHQGKSPLDYRPSLGIKPDHPNQPERAALVDDEAGEPPKGDFGFRERRYKTYTNPDTGRKLKNPREVVEPGAAPGTVSFVDYSYHPSQKYLFIHYMKTRNDQRGQGHARKLIHGLVQAHPEAETVDFGKEMNPTTTHIRKEVADTYPDKYVRGKIWHNGSRHLALRKGDRGMDDHGHVVEYDEMNGFQHLDGSISHNDGSSVTDGPVRSLQNTIELWRPHTGAYEDEYDLYGEPDDDEQQYDTCYHCQREHNPMEHADEAAFNPDWERELKGISSIHRTLPVELPEHEHKIVHDPSTPSHEAAAILLRHVTKPEHSHPHWSAPEGLEYGQHTFGGGGQIHGQTSVTLHARTPEPSHIHDDPYGLIEGEVTPLQEPEHEVPLRYAPVHLTGVSWRHAPTGRWGDDHRWHADPEDSWKHHEFPGGHQIMAAVEHDTYPPTSPHHGIAHHWFEDYDSEGNSRGYADVFELRKHAWLNKLHVNPGNRREGIGGAILSAVTDHFDRQGKATHLLPSPLDDEHGAMEEDELRDWYGRHGFEDSRGPGGYEEMHHTASATHYVVYHGAHHEDIPSIMANGLRRQSDDWTVTTDREGAALHGRSRDWTAPKVVELHIPRGRAHEFLGDPWEATEGTVHSLRQSIPPSMIAMVHEAAKPPKDRGEPYMPDPGDDALNLSAAPGGLGEHLRLRHGVDPEHLPHGDERHWRHWHDSEHHYVTRNDHQHKVPRGHPLEEQFPAAHVIPEDASDVMGISGGTSTRPWQDVKKTGPVILPDLNAHLSSLDPLLAAFNQQLKLPGMPNRRPAPRPPAQLQNPHTQEHDWYHGSPHRFAEFGEPEYMGPDAYETGTTGSHWNTMLGTHFAADRSIAKTFSEGGHRYSGENDGYDDEEEPAGHVVHARLSIANPKHYDSEHDMDQEAYEHEWKAGNHPDNHTDMATWRDAQDQGWDKELRDEEPQYAFVDHKDRMRERWEPAPNRAGEREFHPYAMGWLNAHPDKFDIAQRHRARLEAQGYDGVTYGNEFEKGKHGRNGNTAAIAFHPHQILHIRHYQGDVPDPSMARDAATAGPVSRLSTPLPKGHGHWTPSSGIFAPTTGYDPALFDVNGDLRPSARQEILDRLAGALQQAGYTGGRQALPEWIRVYLAGGSASEWAGSRPNEVASDLDVLAGIDYGLYREMLKVAPVAISDAEIDRALNTSLRQHFNDESWRPAFGGTWSLTGYVNPHAWDITSLRPYAAYDLTNDHWAVKPPHSPDKPLDLGYDPGPQARAIASEIKAITNLPEPYRSQQARALWDHLHQDRSVAFSPEGHGFTDPGNTIEKWLAYHPHKPLDKLRSIVFPKTAGLRALGAWDTSGSDRTGLYLRFGDWPKDERSYSPAGGYHEWGVSAYDLDKHGNPAIDHGLDRDHVHDEGCDEDCDIPTEEYGNDPKEEMQGRITRAERNRYHGEDRRGDTGHLVRGEMAGVGYDGEPLLNHVKRVGDWIDHKHLFFPEGERHRLARDPEDEDYEPPRAHKMPKTAKPEKPTMTKAQVNYRPANGAKRCDNCIMITLKAPDFESHGCDLVNGIIDPAYTCDKFEADTRGTRKEGAYEEEGEHPDNGFGTLKHSELGKLSFTDYPGRKIGYVAKALRAREPRYMADLEAHVRAHGLEQPVEIAHHDEGDWEVGGGHHRAAIAHELGLDVPYVRTAEHGDYAPPESYFSSADHWRNHRRESYPEEYQAYMRRGEPDDPFMGRWAALQDGPLYHGSTKTHPPGTILDGEHSREGLGYVYFSPHKQVARSYAPFWKDSPNGPTQPGHMYEVRPLGQVYRDPGHGLALASERAEVVRELEPHEWPPNASEAFLSMPEHYKGLPYSEASLDPLVAAFEDASEENRQARIKRVKHWIDSKDPVTGFGMRSRYPDSLHVPDSYGEYNPQKIHDVMHHWDPGNVHWHHMPETEVNLRQKIIYGQPTVDRSILKQKIKEHEPFKEGEGETWYDFDDARDTDEHDDPPEEPLFIRHHNQMHLVDGTHRFMRARLLGQNTMWGKVFDVGKPSEHPDRCYDCKEHKQYCYRCGGDDDMEHEGSLKRIAKYPHDPDWDTEHPYYYHVSPRKLPIGTMLKPPGKGWTNWDQSSGEHSYVTPSFARAEQYHAELFDQGHRDIHIHEVKVHGPKSVLEPDPHDDNSFRTHAPVEVIYRHGQDDDDEDMQHEAATNWDDHYARVPEEIHRGLYAPESHDVFTMPQSDEDVAHGLIAAHQEEQFRHHPDRHKLFGTHWTSDEGVARGFAQEHYDNHHDPYEGEEHDHEQHSEAVPVVFHAERPARHEIEHDERRLGWQNVDDYTDSEHEVPIAHGAPVRIKGVSWLHHSGLGPMWYRHDLREPVKLRAHDSDSPSDPNQWNASLKEAVNWESSTYGPQYFGPLSGKTMQGRTGDRSHLTRKEWGMMPIGAVKDMPGARGETPGSGPTRPFDEFRGSWEDFRHETREKGIRPIFITVDHGEEPKLSEGNHRRDMAVEEGHSHIPVEISYFGNAQDEGTVLERHQRRHQASLAAPGEYDGDETELPEEMHRGVPFRFGPEDHAFIHDETKPVHERAQRVLDRIRDNRAMGGTGGFGRHWSADPKVARGFAKRYNTWDHSPYDFVRDPESTEVVFHAAAPQRSHLITSPRTKREREILPYSHGEKEIPLRKRAPVHLTGISWGQNRADAQLTRHDFPSPIRVQAVLPGGDTAPLGSKVEWVRTDALMPHREFHHGPGFSQGLMGEHAGTRFAPKHSPEDWQRYSDSVASEGIREPIHVQYDPGQQTAYIGEGNSRLAWAHEHGHAAVPVTVHRTRYGTDDQAFRVPGTPRVQPDAHGWVPGDLKPSDIFPEHYLWRPGVHKIAIIRDEDMIPEQREAFNVEDFRDHRNKMLDVAKARKPGTIVWRGERRPTGTDPHTVETVGMHWSANPDAIIKGWAGEGETHHVWQGEIEHEDQAFHRHHPMWGGVHESMPSEAEVRFKPGARVKLHGVYTYEKPRTEEDYGGHQMSGMGPVPQHPDRNDPHWKWTPLNRHVTVEWDPKHGGVSDYRDTGVRPGRHYVDPPTREQLGYGGHPTISERAKWDDPKWDEYYAQRAEMKRKSDEYLDNEYERLKREGSLDPLVAAMDPFGMAMHGLTGEDAQDMRDVIEHIRQKKGPGVPINHKDAELMARSFRGRDRMEQAGFQISPHTQESKYPRGVSVELHHNHRLGLVPERHGNETNWYARISHNEYPMAPKLEYTIRTRDEDLPAAVHTFMNAPGREEEMMHQRNEGRRIHEEIRREGVAAHPELRQSAPMTDTLGEVLAAKREELAPFWAARGYVLGPRSGMISLDIPREVSDAIKFPGGVEDHHITLVYLGKDVDDDLWARACQQAARLAQLHGGPMQIMLRGLDSFDPSEGSDWKRPYYVPAILPPRGHEFRRRLQRLNASEHKDWVPHITLAYMGDDEQPPSPVPATRATIPGISVHRGDEVAHFPFRARLGMDDWQQPKVIPAGNQA